MAKTLAHAQDRTEIERRFAALTADAVRRWGTMSVGGMLCHVDDSYQVVIGDRPLLPAKLAIPKGMAKFVSLRLPMRWPRNLPTGENLRQGCGGTPPVTFAEDRARVLKTLDRFCACTTLIQEHPFFGSMTAAEWMRWGYLHADHHLRQFSA
ncbi:MAG TPA: DUF1569 domain-containing protein [Acidobacteriaceae bacterium]